MPYKNKSKRKAYGKKWRHKNKQKQTIYSQKWKQKLKEWYIEYKTASKCVICNESRNSVLESHHVHPENKTFCMHEGVKKGISIRRLKIEARKCLVLCSNHHKLVHYGGLNADEQQIWNDRLKLFDEQGGSSVFDLPEKEKLPKKSKKPKSTVKVRTLKP